MKGWERKAELRLAKILELRKKSDDQVTLDEPKQSTSETVRQLTLEEVVGGATEEHEEPKEPEKKDGNLREQQRRRRPSK